MSIDTKIGKIGIMAKTTTLTSTLYETRIFLQKWLILVQNLNNAAQGSISAFKICSLLDRRQSPVSQSISPKTQPPRQPPTVLWPAQPSWHEMMLLCVSARNEAVCVSNWTSLILITIYMFFTQAVGLIGWAWIYKSCESPWTLGVAEVH